MITQSLIYFIVVTYQVKSQPAVY